MSLFICSAKIQKNTEVL